MEQLEPMLPVKLKLFYMPLRWRKFAYSIVIWFCRLCLWSIIRSAVLPYAEGNMLQYVENVVHRVSKMLPI